MHCTPKGAVCHASWTPPTSRLRHASVRGGFVSCGAHRSSLSTTIGDFEGIQRGSWMWGNLPRGTTQDVVGRQVGQGWINMKINSVFVDLLLMSRRRTSVQMQSNSSGDDRCPSSRWQDPWELLGVDPHSASEKDIKKAHRKKVLQYHPDKHGGNKQIERKFIAIQEAYEMLMGRRHGSLHTQGRSNSRTEGWSFHDWFWSFSYHRRRKQEAAGGQYHHGRPPPPSGHWKQQMVDLKKKAAMRRMKAKPNKFYGSATVSNEDANRHEGVVDAMSKYVMEHEEEKRHVAGSNTASHIAAFHVASGEHIFETNEPNIPGEEQHAAHRHATSRGEIGSSQLGQQLAGLKRKAHLKKKILRET